MSDENENTAEVAESSANELSLAPVIELDALLKPIPGESPVGESVRYSGVYDQINEARREDDDLAQGQWKTDRKIADYREVIRLAVPVLEKESKDLQIAAWLSEALVHEHG
ncbi:MAG: type VI secretion system ImpA family N-terminal domain-containing protein, partial [Acidobacteria bacterium]|nr:type VI secretion system ImpA family N-terminal domain-containing protein [Acidobacteriota bacterium]